MWVRTWILPLTGTVVHRHECHHEGPLAPGHTLVRTEGTELRLTDRVISSAEVGWLRQRVLEKKIQDWSDIWGQGGFWAFREVEALFQLSAQRCPQCHFSITSAIRSFFEGRREKMQLTPPMMIKYLDEAEHPKIEAFQKVEDDPTFHR